MSGNKKDQPWRTMKYPNYCGQEEGVPNPNIPDSGLFLYGYTNTKNPNRLRGGNADFFLQKASKATWNHGCVTFNCILVPLRAEVEPVPLTLYTDISPAFQPFQTSGPLKDVWFIRAQNIRGFTFLTKLKGEYKSINSTCVVYKLCVFNVSKYGSNEILL